MSEEYAKLRRPEFRRRRKIRQRARKRQPVMRVLKQIYAPLCEGAIMIDMSTDAALMDLFKTAEATHGGRENAYGGGRYIETVSYFDTKH